MSLAEPLSNSSSLCADYSHNDDINEQAGARLLINDIDFDKCSEWIKSNAKAKRRIFMFIYM